MSTRCARCKELHTTHTEIPNEGNFMESISDFIGSVGGIVFLAVVEGFYMVFGASWGFDKYPFPFLTLVLSLIALQFSQIIIVVQNRQGAILERKAQVEREQVAEDIVTDKQALKLITELHNKVVGNGS